MKLTTWGAARQVTGSMHLLDIDGYTILVDCGLDYENDQNGQANEYLPFDPETIDVVLLTHAHIDHSGNVPTLIKMGYQGQILCTSATADLTSLLLTDVVNVSLEKSGLKRSKSKHHRRKHVKAKPPLFLHKHVNDTIERMVTIGFNKKFSLKEGIDLTFYPVGHLLGAAALVIEVNRDGKTESIAFSGDIGRDNYPVLEAPQRLPVVNHLVCESTYGGRQHSKGNTIDEVLYKEINDACVKLPGRMIIPAFSVGRTQALLFSLNRLFVKGMLPPVKVFVDSPLGKHATEVFRRYRHLLNKEAQDFYAKEGDLFEFENLHFVEDLKESKAISNYTEPCIIISSAGMLEGGRIRDHLYNNIQNYYCTILFIGYCAKGTLGHRLLRGDSFVHIKDRELSVFATIRHTDLFSAHAGQDELVGYIGKQDPQKLENLILVHGDEENMSELATITSKMGYNTIMASKGITIDL